MSTPHAKFCPRAGAAIYSRHNVTMGPVIDTSARQRKFAMLAYIDPALVLSIIEALSRAAVFQLGAGIENVCEL